MSDLRVGAHLIDAVVFDTDGNIGLDQVEIVVTNEAPEVTLLEPLDGVGYVVGELVHVRASSFDFNENPTMELPDTAMSWDSSLDGVLGTGHELDIVLGEGTHVLTVTGTDAAGAIATDSVSLDVVPGVDFGPVVSITTPPDDVDRGDPDWLDWQYDGYDTSAGMLYKDVLLIGGAEDPEDGTLTGTSLVWTTDRTDLQPTQLGTGEAFDVRLFATDPCSTTHVVTLEATDSYGNVRPAGASSRCGPFADWRYTGCSWRQAGLLAEVHGLVLADLTLSERMGWGATPTSMESWPNVANRASLGWASRLTLRT